MKVKKVCGSICTSRFLNCESPRSRIVAAGVSMLIARRSENFLATGKWSHQSVFVPKTWPAKACGGAALRVLVINKVTLLTESI